MLFGLTPTDTVTFVLAGGVMLIVAVVGAALPAARAARVDPSAALRAE
jgi:ABC-type antimicrobial peptide transport system permease subunit